MAPAGWVLVGPDLPLMGWLLVMKKKGKKKKLTNPVVVLASNQVLVQPHQPHTFIMLALTSHKDLQIASPAGRGCSSCLFAQPGTRDHPKPWGTEG